jgi:hypothetical protein
MKSKDLVSIGACFPALALPIMQRRKGGKTYDIKDPVCNRIFSAICHLVINARLYEIKLGPGSVSGPLLWRETK